VRLIHAILALLLLILSLLLWLMVIPEPALSTGGTHTIFPGMNSGGDGLARLGEAVGPIGLLGAASFLMMILLTALGVREERRDRVFWLLMTGIAVLTQYVWWTLYSSYLDYLHTAKLGLALGFPVPTSWMLFGVWTSGACLCLLYVFGFRRFILNGDDEAAYEKLRAQAETPRAHPADGGST